MATNKNPDAMYELLEEAFSKTSTLMELIEKDIDRSVKYAITKTTNELHALMTEVEAFEKEVTSDVIAGMYEVIENARAYAKGQPVSFRSDETSLDMAA